VKAAKAKSARRRLVTMQDNLSGWLCPIAKRAGAVAPANLRNMILEVRKAAQINDWPPNALRHSYASYHLAHFNSSAALALELGHTNSNLIFQHYRQVVKPMDAERYWNIRPAIEKNVVAMTA
jgi:integrase